MKDRLEKMFEERDIAEEWVDFWRDPRNKYVAVQKKLDRQISKEISGRK